MSNSTPITKGTIFTPLIAGNPVLNRRDVVIEVKSEDEFFTRTIFKDDDGNNCFRSGAGGTSGIHNIGDIIGQMPDEEIERLRKRVNERI